MSLQYFTFGDSLQNLK